jgi:lipoate-protein ligase A
VTWRCIIDAPRDGAANMAMDQALLEGVQAECRPVLRLYRWQPGCLSLGRNQTARGVYDATRTGIAGTDIVRRPTGGLAVWHHHELTYAAIAPASTFGRPRTAYHSINRALAAGLARLGAPVAIARGDAAPGPLAAQTHPCFAEAAAGEVVTHGRKLVGSAMRCEKRALLQHGSILLDGDQSEVATLMSVPLMNGAPPPITLSEATGRIPAWSELYDAILAGFADAMAVAFEPGRPTEAECARARALEPIYRSEAWTWRR